MSHSHRILLIRPSALGDVCRTVPALVSVRAGYPDAHIEWLVQEEFAPAIEAHPALDGVATFPRRAVAGWWRRPAPAGRLLRWLRELSRRDYDLVFDLQGLLRSGIFAWATRAETRVGPADARELGWLGYNRRHRIGSVTHTVDRMLALLDASGVDPIADMKLYAPKADGEALPAELMHASYAVLAPTSRWLAKRWPAERFRALAEALLDDGSVERVAVVGAHAERAQCRSLIDVAQRDRRVVDLVGATDVGGLMRLIERSDLVIANDSAALHMGVGFDRPLVGLFGPTRLEEVGPYRRESCVIQHLRRGDSMGHKQGDDSIMRRISVSEVIDASRAALAPARESAPMSDRAAR